MVLVQFGIGFFVFVMGCTIGCLVGRKTGMQEGYHYGFAEGRLEGFYLAGEARPVTSNQGQTRHIRRF